MNQNRPLSPHLQVYRLPLTAMLSITHRITGVILTVGMLFFVNGIVALAQGAQAFASFQEGMNSFLGKIILLGWLFSLFFHLCHGVRHLVWDAGSGMAKQYLDKASGIEIAIALGLSVTILVLAAII